MEPKQPDRRMKLLRRTPEQKAAAERRRLDPLMAALKVLHSATPHDSMRPEDLERERRA